MTSTNTSLRKSRKIEKWNIIFNELKLDPTNPLSFVTAKQIKSLSNEEARLMAKMDTIDNLPKIFQNNSLFLVPVSRGGYAIIKGKGYHSVEPFSEKICTHYTNLPLPTSVLGLHSEGVFLEYANSCGLLKKVTGISNLIQTFRGRRTTPDFTFQINNIVIDVRGAQIEVDAVFESMEEIIIFEAKVGFPTSFNIRQVYYPFRAFRNKKNIRNFLFYFDKQQKIYRFWEYEFSPHDSFGSIKFVQNKQYIVKVSNVISTKQFFDVEPNKTKLDIPQADDVNKIMQLPLRVVEGYNTSTKIQTVFGFVNRQSSYYRHAAELLGLVETNNDIYKLTEIGKNYIRLSADKKSNFICKLLLQFPIINEVFLEIMSDKDKVVSKQDIILLLRKTSNLTGSTLERRARTIISWFRWMRNNLGIVELDSKGDIIMSKFVR